MDASLRDRVRHRAGNRCEYCRLHQDHEPYFRFQIEHVIARQHGGRDVASNLALSCYHCNLHKGPSGSGGYVGCGNLAAAQAGGCAAQVPARLPATGDLGLAVPVLVVLGAGLAGVGATLRRRR